MVFIRFTEIFHFAYLLVISFLCLCKFYSFKNYLSKSVESLSKMFFLSERSRPIRLDLNENIKAYSIFFYLIVFLLVAFCPQILFVTKFFFKNVIEDEKMNAFTLILIA